MKSLDCGAEVHNHKAMLDKLDQLDHYALRDETDRPMHTKPDCPRWSIYLVGISLQMTTIRCMMGNMKPRHDASLSVRHLTLTK